MDIDGRKINNSNKPYIIAELSANHCGSLERALKTIESAKNNGADAIKLQTYKASSMTLDCNKDDFLIKEGTWKGYKLYDLYKEASTPYEWHKTLFEFARDIGITIFSSPFDEEAVDLLEDLGTPAYKIASFEIVDLPLIKYAALRGKPLLISTGMASKNEIDDAINTAKKYGSGDILLFHCVSDYPAATKDSNIKLINYLKERYHLEVGLSDHTLSHTAALASVSLGAVAIEKHFILDKKLIGPDSSFSIDPKQLRSLREITIECWEAMGTVNLKRPISESKNIIFRRSLYFVEDMRPGEVITSRHIKRLRPGYGLAPKFTEKILNKRLKKPVEKGDRVTWDCIES